MLAYNDRQTTHRVRVISGNAGFDYDIPKKSAVTFLWASAAPLPAPPLAPSNLSATALSASSIYLSWSDNANNETGFELQRSLNGSSNWQTVAMTPANILSATDNALSPGTTYYYRLRATNAAGNSTWSNVASATTPSSGGTFTGTYNILAQHSNKGLDVINLSGNNNANVQQWEVINGGGDNQRWQLTANADGSYRIQAVHSGKCLAIFKPNRNNVVQQSCSGTNEQHWLITDLGSAYFRLVNVSNGQALAVANADLSNGANVETEAYTGAPHQKWRFDAIAANLQSPQIGTAVAQSTGAGLIVFPNPALDRLLVSLPHAVNGLARLDCYDTQGRKRWSHDLVEGAGQIISIDVSAQSPGLYLLVLMDSGPEVVSRRFVIYR